MHSRHIQKSISNAKKELKYAENLQKIKQQALQKKTEEYKLINSASLER
jgi:hypothetical protein